MDNAAGMYPTDVIYNDMDAAQIETLAPTQKHRNVDLLGNHYSGITSPFSDSTSC